MSGKISGIYYIICSQQRSGTALLRHLLSSVGAGNPVEFGRLLSPTKTDIQTIDDLYTVISKNNCFGVTIQQSDYTHTINWLKQNAGTQNANDIEILNRYFPKAKFIYLHRLNRIKQAISVIKCHRTGYSINPPEDYDLGPYSENEERDSRLCEGRRKMARILQDIQYPSTSFDLRITL